MRKIYLAIPYSGMEPSSYYQATRATAYLMRDRDINVFSPITHSHPLKEYNLPGVWAYWEQVDYQYLEWADELWILVPDEGFEKIMKSEGVLAEIAYANKYNIPLQYIKVEAEKVVKYDKKERVRKEVQ